MRGDLVQQQYRIRLRFRTGKSRRLRQNQVQNQRFLLAGRTFRPRRRPFCDVRDQKIAPVRAGQRPSGGRVAGAGGGQGAGQPRPDLGSAGAPSAASASHSPERVRDAWGNGRSPRAGDLRLQRRKRAGAGARHRRARLAPAAPPGRSATPDRPGSRPAAACARAWRARRRRPATACAGSPANTSRSKKRRRSLAASRKSRSSRGRQPDQPHAARPDGPAEPARRRSARCGAARRRSPAPCRCGPRHWPLPPSAATAQARPCASRGLASADLGDGGVAQTAARDQEADRLQEIGLAGAVRPEQEDRPPVEVEAARS